VALDTYPDIWNRVLLRVPSASSLLAQDWVQNAFRQVAERRPWSWLIKRGQYLFNAVYKTGTVSVTFGSATVAGSGTAFTSAMVGRQFRVGLQVPIYTIAAVPDATTLTLDQAWGGDDASGLGFEIYNAYQTVPADFNYHLSVWDPRYNWQLHLHTSQKELNSYDAQRANQASSSYAVVAYAYDQTVTPPRPQVEFWPHMKSQYSFPYLYVARATDLADSGAHLPFYIRGDVLLEMALAEAARWPGSSRDKPSQYYSLSLAIMHERRAERMIMEMERNDDEVSEQDVQYATSLPFGPMPWVDATWMQSHALG
jgi:hypothetical protein